MVKHLGVILDGNRRFARRLMMQPWKGHEWGAKKVRQLMEWSQELGVKELTLFAFSMQNFNRPQKEFDYLMKVFSTEFDNLQQKDNLQQLQEKGIRIRFIGRTHLFPQDIHEKMKQLEEKTKDNNNYRVNFAMAYGGQEEILDAISAMADKIRTGDIKEITKDLFEQHLYMSSEPDLIIRTGGDKRTSNFLTWQSWYSEWLFLDKFWPEFEREDLVRAVNDFNERERRFGK
ncbi:di-trans,poly-cis-decaprenylcistransferase [Candidatus Woesearchaeota archaeon]|nr:di-trans,poly-cis-decaprenylcistransferase [Candidatus Woesearchaeota archaeon]